MTAEQKTPFAVSITNFVQSKLEQNRQNFGWQLPCRVIAVDGAIVTVNFEIDTGGQYTFPPVTCPIAQSIYVRLPVQIGDLGMCISADARLGGITGLGVKGALSPLGLPFNLGALVYVPLGANDWSTVDPNAVNINAPNGVVLRDTNNNCTVTLTPSGVIVAIGSTSLLVQSAGVTVNGKFTVNGNVETTGTLKNNGVSVGSTHKHSGVQTGGSNTGNPV
jgi:hypothetical protein